VSSPWRSTEIPGLFRTDRPALLDDRGSFHKILGEGDEGDAKAFTVREIYWSHSVRGTFRGLHVPLPPRPSRKVVFVAHGVVRDVIVDLRRGSPTEHRVWQTELTSTSGGLVIPEGCAHGFEVLSDDAAMIYGQEDFYSPEHDGGILFSSAGVELSADQPIISARDLELPGLAEFDSPFVFG
jgi:dTDP-4-dehydrorhamnose 3,5-epimerase